MKALGVFKDEDDAQRKVGRSREVFNGTYFNEVW